MDRKSKDLDFSEFDEKRNKAYDPSEFDRDIVFRYSRARRLSKAPRNVKELNDPDYMKRASFFRNFFGSKSNKSLIVIIMLLLFLIPFMTSRDGLIKLPNLGGNAISAKAVRDGEGTRINIQKTFRERDRDTVYTGVVMLAITPRRENNPDLVTLDRIFFSPDQSEEFSIFIPHQATGFTVLMQAEDMYVNLRVNTR